MSTASDPEPKRGHFIDLSPLRESPAFRKLWLGGAISGIGGQLTLVAVGLDIYRITASTFAVALVGGIALVPMIIAGLYGGMLADAFDRRRILFIAAIVAWSATITLVILSLCHVETVAPFYVVTTVNAVATTVISTVRAAVTPRLLEPRLIPAASALIGIGAGLSITLGPALAGVLVATVGFAGTYSVDVVLFVASFVGILSLPKLVPLGDIVKPGLESLRDGYRFLRTSPNVRVSFIVDIVAMTFGQPRVLFPALGALVLGGGAITVGILTAAGAVGALLCSLLSGRAGGVRWQGRATGLAVIAYGAAIALFGFVALFSDRGLTSAPTHGAIGPNYLAIGLASLALAAAGAADNVSVIFRETILQSSVPDAIRGRLQGIFTIVVTGGPRIGDLFVGALAAFGALWLPPLLGGILIIGIIAAILRWQSTFRHYDARDPKP